MRNTLRLLQRVVSRKEQQRVKSITLTRGVVALVDDEDYERINQHNWHAQAAKNKYYACAHMEQNGKRTKVYMHRYILGAPEGMQVDHIDNCGLNNCRSNLRLVNQSQNLMAARKLKKGKSSKYRGVSLLQTTSGNYWQAHLSGKYVGNFYTEEEAAKARDAAAKEKYGEVAWLNFPDEPTGLN